MEEMEMVVGYLEGEDVIACVGIAGLGRVGNVLSLAWDVLGKAT